MPVDVSLGPLFLRGGDERLLVPDEFAARIENMLPTEEGTLRSVEGPTPWWPARATTNGNPDQPVVPAHFGIARAIFHAIVKGKDCLFLHDGDSYRIYQGWTPGWGDGGLASGDCLLGPTATRTPILDFNQPVVLGPEAPTQWVATPNGVVIVPPRGRAYFFDGETVALLGYDRAPAAPIGLGPVTSTNPNDAGFAHDATTAHADFGYGRKGTVEQFPGSTGVVEDGTGTTVVDNIGHAGRLLRGSFRAAVQWVDRWGNLSPLSSKSNAIVLSPQDSWSGVGIVFNPIEALPKYFAWTGITPGPERTIGRQVFVTPDENHAGTTELFALPSAIVGGLFGFATIPDNVSTTLPDNVPDAWLGAPALRVIATPEFRVAALVYGRLFVIEADSSRVRWSQPGLWGTFLEDDFLDLDSMADGTALQIVTQGLLGFTKRGTFLISPANNGFSHRAVHSSRGCVAPDSCEVMSNGVAVWFGGDSFYSYDGTVVSDVGLPMRPRLQRINRSRWVTGSAAIDPVTGMYICALAEGSDRVNGIAYGLTAAGKWHLFPGLTARQFTTTADHRQILLYAGSATGQFRVGSVVETAAAMTEGAWVFNHLTAAYNPATTTSAVETTWLESDKGPTKKSPSFIHLWLRETDGSAVTVEIYKNWRKTVEETLTLTPYPEDDLPPRWGTTVLGSTVFWRNRRPFWHRLDIAVPASDVFKIRISRTSQSPWEFVALQVQAHIAGSRGRFN